MSEIEYTLLFVLTFIGLAIVVIDQNKNEK